MKRLLAPTAALLPIPCVLVVSGNLENANIITVSLTGLVNVTPPMVAVSLRPQTHSHDIVARSGEFTVNVPHEGMLAQTDVCGVVSGRDTDKFEYTGLTKVSSSLVAPPIIEESILSLECVVRQATKLGSHTLFVGEIVQAHVDQGVIDENERVDLDKALPFVYCPLIHEYRIVGGKLAKYGFTKGNIGIGDTK